MRIYRRRGQDGSALLIAILAMVFLTVIGLTLAMVTETEMLIGTNEQIAEENFVAAEAGIANAVSQLLVNNDLESRFFAIQAKTPDGTVRQVQGRNLGYSVDFTDVYPTARQCAPYTDCGVQAPGDHKYSYFFFTRVRSRRLAWPNTQAVPDCGSESKRDSDAPIPSTLEYFQQVQAENVVTLGFYASPLPELGGDALWESFVKPDVFGCSPEKKDAEYVQNVAAPPPPP